MEPNTDRMTFAIVVLLIGGALAGILLTPGLPGLMGLKDSAGVALKGIGTPGAMNFMQWIFSLIGANFQQMIGRNTKNGGMAVIQLLGTIKAFAI